MTTAANELQCQGAGCGYTDGRHSRECVIEAGEQQGWVPTEEELASCAPTQTTGKGGA